VLHVEEFRTVTDSSPASRNAGSARRFRRAGVLLVLFVALALRLHGVDFGLPALNDADEPLFMMTAFEMLQKQTLNPHWFGHPGTTTLYSLAAVMLAVVGFGVASGRYADVAAFGKAAYLDPGLAWLPARVMIALCGVICVYLVYRLGRRLGGARLGLVAALFLAVNAVHIEYSQIIRTDMQASIFMLLCALSAVAIVREGKLRDYLLAGAFVGLACATKWPAALMGASPACAGLYRLLKGHRELRHLALFGLIACATLIVVSPYLLLDYQTVLYNLSREARPVHPGATGGGFLFNLGWYLAHPLLTSLGWGGLVLALAGLAWPSRGSRDWALAVLPGCLVYLTAIAAQALLWERWIVPVLPFAALAAARALCGLADRLAPRWRAAEAPAALVLALPMLHAAWTNVIERTHDTRQAAAAWVRAHVPADRTILIEHAGFDMLQGPWTFRFPLGSAGCIDAREALAGRIRYSEVEARRSGSPIVDIGYVDAKLLATCQADYAVITHYDRYRADPRHFGPELERYRRLLRGGRERAVFRPVDGVSAGPVVRIIELRPRAAARGGDGEGS
jgi:hypothetical protein